MKILNILIVLLFACNIAFSQNKTYKVEGRIFNLWEGEVTIFSNYRDPENSIIAKVPIKNEYFSLELELEHPMRYYINTNRHTYIPIFFEGNSTIRIRSFKENNRGRLKILNGESNVLNRIYEDNVYYGGYGEEMKLSGNEITLCNIYKNPNSLFALALLEEKKDGLSHIQIEKMLCVLGDRYIDHPYYKSILKEYEEKKMIAPGSDAKNLEGTTVKGDSINLNNYKGKIVVLDYWASLVWTM